MDKRKSKQRPSRSREARTARRKAHGAAIRALKEQIATLDPTDPPAEFNALPLSDETKRGLSASHFVKMTDIQRRSIPWTLKGRDVLGAAETGSGKTLCFLIPVLEVLHRANWNIYDGVGALIVSPTRELAMQTFEVLRSIGRFHTLSAGLIIGGKDIKDEKERISRMNILICTPGRLLQHIDQTLGLQTENLKMLVLDEADRILDLGFQKTLDAILSGLPKQRQTLLFSATQTTDVKTLARLSLTKPLYVAAEGDEASATPARLQQFYVVIELHKKLDALFAFIRTHLKAKVLVFLSSCKQVRFVYEAFRQLQPGVPLMHIHGSQKQTLRFTVSAKFSAAKHAYLFCTDVVARGLDFAAVDWVIQVDIPDSATTYIHRVGRTARFNKDGRALLFVAPSEKTILDRLEDENVHARPIKIDERKAIDIKQQLQHIAFKSPEMKYLAQKKDKEVFKIDELPLEEFAKSLGLAGAPVLNFFNYKKLSNRTEGSALANTGRPTAGEVLSSTSDTSKSENCLSPAESNDDSDSSTIKDLAKDETTDRKATDENPLLELNGKSSTFKPTTKFDKLRHRQTSEPFQQHRDRLIAADAQDTQCAEDDDFLTMKRIDHELEGEPGETTGLARSYTQGPLVPAQSKRKILEAQSRKKLKKYMPRAERLVFDDEGHAHPAFEFQDEASVLKDGSIEDQRQEFVAKERAELAKRDAEDYLDFKDKRRQKRLKMKNAAREANADADALEYNHVTTLNEQDLTSLDDLRATSLDVHGTAGSGTMTVEEQEQLALDFLTRGRDKSRGNTDLN